MFQTQPNRKFVQNTQNGNTEQVVKQIDRSSEQTMKAYKGMIHLINDNIVVFKGRKDSIAILLDDEIEFNLLEEVFTRKVKAATNFFNGGKSALTFQGRKLSEKEEARLIEILSSETSFNISFLRDEEIGTYIVKEDKPARSVEVKIGQVVFDARENNTIFHRGTLRNGQSLNHRGSIVLLGDLNAGAEIIAEGNVIILGLAKGVVHAGAKGNTDCYVVALGLMLTQLRIADIITYIPDEVKAQNKMAVKPLQAYIQDGQLYISPL